MYLWRIEMDLSSPRIRQALMDRQKMHQLVTGLFGASRKDADLLYRYKTIGVKVLIYIYSSTQIEKGTLSGDVRLSAGQEVSGWLAGMQNGMVMNFDLLTMPFKKVYDGTHKNSRRRLLRQAEDRIEWLNRKAEQNGFSIITVREDPAERVFGIHPAARGGKLYLDTWRYTGTLRIEDETRFRSGVQNGIGPDKAYGLGMMLLA